MRLIRSRLAILIAAGVIAIALLGWALAGAGRPKPVLGLFTTLPIYWAEAADMSEMISGGGHPGWVRGALEKRFELLPLDTLAPPERGAARDLGDIDILLLAQPRALSPQENVALDEWVRAGGHVLVFADPMLTAHSRFAIGDRRRPQDVALLSPILARWGLEMRFDPEQEGGERLITTDLAPLPVHLAGTLHPIDGYPTRTENCWIAYDRLFAQCAIGDGEATIVADAAVFEEAEGERRKMRADALEWLTASAFGDGTRR
ncbi:ABC transporter [Pelagerythrobacter rhizovicinus]|uniref:ABC transporter n=2 Tax=Pelagerythrobacter rhizovicinus TaxID=2268576 RepID=A0A4Q2KL54_9SPHN|nr:ABC transporter [Pelagerythrobacter rhizovicinus]